MYTYIIYIYIEREREIPQACQEGLRVRSPLPPRDHVAILQIIYIYIYIYTYREREREREREIYSLP